MKKQSNSRREEKERTSIVYPSLEDAKIAYKNFNAKEYAIIVYKNGWAEITDREFAQNNYGKN